MNGKTFTGHHLKMLLEQQSGRGSVAVSRVYFAHLTPRTIETKPSPRKARSAIDFQEVQQPICLHAGVSCNHNPSKILWPTVKHTTEKAHHQNQTLLGSEG